MRFPYQSLAALGLALALVGAACGDDSGGGGSSTTDQPSGSGAEVAGSITVSAAASLTDAFGAIGDDFTAANPDASVEFNFGSSSTLATQIVEGAPADVFASASTAAMDTVVDGGANDGDPVVFARNQLEIAVEPGNPLGIESLEDLANPDVTVVLCDPSVPCGQYADQALEEAGVEVTPASREVDVRATLSKVELGEADAAIVYESDVVAADGSVDGVDIPDDENVIATYPIVVIADAGNEDVAEAFLDAVTSDEGQATLEQFGFLKP
jgi:molybdate transport system substrate-binding protein